MQTKYLLITIFFISSSFHIPEKGNIAAEDHEVNISGKITNPQNPKVYIFYYKEYISLKKEYIDSAILDKDGQFSMRFEWGSSSPARFKSGKNYCNLFLSPGDSLYATADALNFNETLTYQGKGAEIQNYLAWKDFTTGMKSSSAMFKMPERIFIHWTDSIRENDLENLRRRFPDTMPKTPQIQAFLAYQENQVNYTWGNDRLNYPGGYTYFNRLQSPVQMSDNYYDFLERVPVNNPSAIHSSAYLRFVSDYVFEEIKKVKATDSTIELIPFQQSYISGHFSGALKEFLFANWIYGLIVYRNDLVNGKQLFEVYKVFATNKVYLETLEGAFLAASKLKVGSPPPDFKLKDIDGKWVSLKDFRGKIVYLDIWATWCGPCLVEIPYADTLHRQMKGKNVVFLYISIDYEEETWKKFVRDKKLKGIQLFSKGGFDSEIARLYNVRGAPQYLIIDKDGKIADNEAKRPSTKVKKDLEAMLK